MLQLRPSTSRGQVDLGWLQSKHSFSFGSYYDPKHMGFHQLRVINEDRVQAGKGFDPHPHRDMEIISYVLAGALEHADSLGNRDVIRAGEVQRMSAGQGVVHSEYNPSSLEGNHFLQIWLTPSQRGLPPSYEQKNFGKPPWGIWRLILSPEGEQDTLRIHQQIRLYDSQVAAGSSLSFDFEPSQALWLQVIEGKLDLEGLPISTGDGVAVQDHNSLQLRAEQDSHLLLFELNPAD